MLKLKSQIIDSESVQEKGVGSGYFWLLKEHILRPQDLWGGAGLLEVEQNREWGDKGRHRVLEKVEGGTDCN